jgi:pSer/pThr/pTyr-binding forkhead associated (FHA) protein
MMYRLIFLNSAAKGQRVTVELAPMTIGRDPDCQIVVKDEEVSRKHAVLEHKPEGLFIRDLGSMNRILVNNREVREKRLKHGDIIELGRTQLLVQAVVQAEVEAAEGKEEVSPKKEFVLTTTIFVILLAAVVVGGLIFWHKLAASKARRAAALASTNQWVANRPAATTPAKAATTATNRGAQEVSEELRYMRKALTDIRETVDKLAQTRATSVVATGSSLAPTNEWMVADRALRTKAALMLEEAHSKAATNAFDEADQILAGIQLMLPDYLPAYEERARLYEKQGQLEKAIGQWVHIIQRSTDTNLAQKAMSERTRLGQAETTATPASSRRISIASVDQHKFLESDDFDEMRILNIALSAKQSLSASNASAVRVEVVFFDEDRQTGRIAPTSAVAPKDSLHPEGIWPAEEQKIVTATYVVPRARQPNGSVKERSARYYGYVVKVYYRDRLEDQDARPLSLLRYTPAGWMGSTGSIRHAESKSPPALRP